MPSTVIPAPASDDEPPVPSFTLEQMRDEMFKITQAEWVKKMLNLLPESLIAELYNNDSRREARRFIGMIDAMTLAERRDPRLLDDSRRRRIAQGAGVAPHEVRALIKQFQIMQRIIGRQH